MTRYFEFLDRERSKKVLAAGVKEAFSDLFGINTRANELGAEEVKNKLRTLYAGKKTDLVVGNIAKTFKSLCEYADFSAEPTAMSEAVNKESTAEPPVSAIQETQAPKAQIDARAFPRINVSGLQYHINVVLPDTRDQAVYDAIFKSLREHLG